MRQQREEHSLQRYTHSFIVRVWLEGPARGALQAVWRGHVTHVPTGKRRYLTDLAEVVEFIRPCLAEMDDGSDIPHERRATDEN